MGELQQSERADLARLLDESAIRSIVTRYTSAIDWMNWPLLESLFWPDATIDFGASFAGNTTEFLRFVVPLEEQYTRRMHMFSGARIALYGEEAEAETGSLTHVRSVVGENRIDDLIYGRYLMKLQRRDREWRLSHMHYMLNNFERHESKNSDEGPMNLADHTSMAHPCSPRF